MHRMTKKAHGMSGMEVSKNFKVLLGCTASKECCNIITLVELLQGLKIGGRIVEVEVIVTELALNLTPLQKLKNLCKVYTDIDEWERWDQNQKVLHIELRRTADIFIIAPIDADTLGRIATGLCDNLLTCVVRAWDFTKPLVFCPAMNSHMWNHPITATHISKLKDYGYIEIPCKFNDEISSDGTMADMKMISLKVEEILKGCSLGKQ